MDLGKLLQDKDDYEGAEALFRRALEGRQKALGVKHPDTLSSMENLGNFLKLKLDYEGAEALYRRALEGWEKIKGADHYWTLFKVNNLGVLLNKINRRGAAIKLLREWSSHSNEVADNFRSELACYECLEGNLEEAKRLIQKHLALHPAEKYRALADDDFATIRDFIETL
jgi:tetratricopeptide (TPR) repeat protein